MIAPQSLQPLTSYRIAAAIRATFGRSAHYFRPRCALPSAAVRQQMWIFRRASAGHEKLKRDSETRSYPAAFLFNPSSLKPIPPRCNFLFLSDCTTCHRVSNRRKRLLLHSVAVALSNRLLPSLTNGHFFICACGRCWRRVFAGSCLLCPFPSQSPASQ